MSHHEEKKQAAKPKMKQNEQHAQNPAAQGKQQPGIRPQDVKGSVREDGVAQLRTSEGDRSSQQRWGSESDRSSSKGERENYER